MWLFALYKLFFSYFKVSAINDAGVNAHTRSFGDCIQTVLHAAARLITGVRWNDHITPTLRDLLRDTLYCLPVSLHIIFKIVLMTYDCMIRDRSPAYFRDVCVPVIFVSFRSADNNMIVPHTRTTCALWSAQFPYRGSPDLEHAAISSKERLLRSGKLLLLTVPRAKLAIGQRAFSYSSAVIWNAIPLSVRDAPSVSTFKRRLKSFYFNSLLSKS